MFYRTTRFLFRLVAAPVFRFRVEGREKLPARGPAVVVAPHRSWLDPPAVGAAYPRPVRFLILRKVYERRAARWFFRLMGSLPVAPGKGGSLTGFRGALRCLRAGEVVGIFPEGRVVRHGSSPQIHPGAALLAVRSGAPVIPVEIHGSADAWPNDSRWPRPAAVRVRFRDPLPPPERRDREAMEAMQRKIEALMRNLDEVCADSGGSAGAERRADRHRQ